VGRGDQPRRRPRERLWGAEIEKMKRVRLWAVTGGRDRLGRREGSAIALRGARSMSRGDCNQMRFLSASLKGGDKCGFPGNRGGARFWASSQSFHQFEGSLLINYRLRRKSFHEGPPCCGRAVLSTPEVFNLSRFRRTARHDLLLISGQETEREKFVSERMERCN